MENEVAVIKCVRRVLFEKSFDCIKHVRISTVKLTNNEPNWWYLSFPEESVFVIETNDIIEECDCQGLLRYNLADYNYNISDFYLIVDGNGNEGINRGAIILKEHCRIIR